MRNLAYLLASLLFLAACGDGDGGSGGVDGGGGPDASADAAPGSADGGPDARPGPDAAPCPAAYAECALYTDRTDKTEVTIEIVGESYVPACVRVKSGTTVTIEAAAGHPLVPASCSPDSFLSGGAKTADTTFKAGAPGVYGFHCRQHGTDEGTGMAGALKVE